MAFDGKRTVKGCSNVRVLFKTFHKHFELFGRNRGGAGKRFGLEDRVGQTALNRSKGRHVLGIRRIPGCNHILELRRQVSRIVNEIFKSIHGSRGDQVGPQGRIDHGQKHQSDLIVINFSHTFAADPRGGHKRSLLSKKALISRRRLQINIDGIGHVRIIRIRPLINGLLVIPFDFIENRERIRCRPVGRKTHFIIPDELDRTDDLADVDLSHKLNVGRAPNNRHVELTGNRRCVEIIEIIRQNPLRIAEIGQRNAHPCDRPICFCHMGTQNL